MPKFVSVLFEEGDMKTFSPHFVKYIAANLRLVGDPDSNDGATICDAYVALLEQQAEIERQANAMPCCSCGDEFTNEARCLDCSLQDMREVERKAVERLVERVNALADLMIADG